MIPKIAIRTKTLILILIISTEFLATPTVPIPMLSQLGDCGADKRKALEHYIGEGRQSILCKPRFLFGPSPAEQQKGKNRRKKCKGINNSFYC